MAAHPSDMTEHCSACSGTLEIGQIGKCDDCQPKPEKWFCLGADGHLHFIGECPDFESAEEAWAKQDKGASTWIFSEDSAREFLDVLNQHL